MKILLITPFFPPEVGSAAHLYYELGLALKARGHEVTVLTGLPRYHVLEPASKTRRRPLLREDFQGLKVLRLFNLDIPWDVPALRGLDQLAFAAGAWVAGIGLPNFDVALVYSPPLPLALAALGLCAVKRRPLVVNIQDLFPQSAVDLGVLKNPLLIRLFKGMETFLYRHGDLIAVHSRGNREYVVQQGGDPGRVTVLANWVDTQAIKPGRRRNKLRASLGLDDCFLVSFAGIMGYSQDLETPLASANLLKKHENIRFLFVGDGVEKKKLQQIARDARATNVHFLPLQPKDKYPEVLAASDVCLVTLRPEVLTPVVPSKILSIMAAGRPVLAALPPTGDAPGLIAAAGCGLCVSPGDPEALAQAVLQLYHHPALRAKMGRRGRQYAETHLSLESRVAQLEQHLVRISATST